MAATAKSPWGMKGLKLIFAEEKLCWPMDLKSNGQSLAPAIEYADTLTESHLLVPIFHKWTTRIRNPHLFGLC